MFAKENYLIDYQLHQFRLIPRLARGIVQKYAHDEVQKLWIDNSKDVLVSTSKDIKLIHALTGYFKSANSTAAFEDISEARQALGGLGYSYYSKLATFIGNVDLNNTFEGDNKVLL